MDLKSAPDFSKANVLKRITPEYGCGTHKPLSQAVGVRDGQQSRSLMVNSLVRPSVEMKSRTYGPDNVA